MEGRGEFQTGTLSRQSSCVSQLPLPQREGACHRLELMHNSGLHPSTPHPLNPRLSYPPTLSSTHHIPQSPPPPPVTSIPPSPSSASAPSSMLKSPQDFSQSSHLSGHVECSHRGAGRRGYDELAVFVGEYARAHECAMQQRGGTSSP